MIWPESNYAKYVHSRICEDMVKEYLHIHLGIELVRNTLFTGNEFILQWSKIDTGWVMPYIHNDSNGNSFIKWSN